MWKSPGTRERMKYLVNSKYFLMQSHHSIEGVRKIPREKLKKFVSIGT